MTAEDAEDRHEADADERADERIAELEAAITTLQGQLGRLRSERVALANDLDEAQRQLRRVYTSSTWRAGRLAIGGPARLARAVKGNPRARELVRRLRSRGASPSVSTARRAPPAAAADIVVTQRPAARAAYESALARAAFSGTATGIVMAVSTTDLDEGRGDLYTAIGLGRELEELGYEVVYRAPDRWYDPPPGTDVFVAMLAERTAMVDPLRLPGSVTRLAWARNLTQVWATSGTLPFYDGVLCSSRATLRSLQRVCDGPTALLRIGVDEALFGAGGETRGDLVVATVNAWGQERRLHRTLRELDVDFPLALFGQQRGTGADLAAHARGPVSFFALPTLYSQAALVLDDVQNVNVAHGNINSRVFESLACGALPIANAAGGLHEVGLEAVPVAEAPKALADVIARFREDPSARDHLVAQLQDVVLRQHTYRARAASFHEFLTERVGRRDGTDGSDGTRVAVTDRPAVVGFFPDYRATNPYQDMLYRRAHAHHLVAVPTDDPAELARSPAMADRRLAVHVHWTATVLGPASSRGDAQARCDRFLAGLDAVKERGGSVLWTVHNTMPHECRYPAVEERLRAGLVERCDLVHVMCPETADLLPETVRLPPDRTVVVGHGSYVDVYPNVVTPSQARLELGVPPDAAVLLFLGGIRPYKGLDELLDAFAVVSRERGDLRLLVAGAPGRFHEAEQLVARCEAHPAVLTHTATVPDTELQTYLNACDAVVLPHRTVLNSGGLQLAWSFGRPVIARRAGCLTGQVAEPAGRLFDGQDELLAALRAIDQLRTGAARRASYERAVAYPYTAMSEEFCALVSKLVTEVP